MGRPRPLRPLRQSAEALLLRLLGAMAQSLGLERAGDLGAWLGRRAYAVLGRRRRIAIENLTRALGPTPAGAPAASVAGRVFEEVGRSFLEFLALPAEPREALLARITWIGFEPAEAWAREGRGAVVLTGHYGNWELIGSAYGMRYAPVKYVLPRQTNPASDAYLNAVRRRLGVEPIPIGQGMRLALRSLKRGFCVGMLPDQDARRAGIHVPFFGRPASTHTGPARLAIRAGAPILLAVLDRVGRGRFEARALTVIEPDRAANEAQETERITRLVTEELERAIRAKPEAWYWIHRRWKTPPEPSTGAPRAEKAVRTT